MDNYLMHHIFGWCTPKFVKFPSYPPYLAHSLLFTIDNTISEHSMSYESINVGLVII